MSTSFEKIYDRAMFKFKDYDFLDLPSEIRHTILFNYLVSAQSEFERFCHIDLAQRDDFSKEYETDLSDQEIEILSLGIAYYWLSSNTLDQDKLHNRLNTKDYTAYSPANLANVISELRNETEKDFRQAIRRYTYQHGDLTNPLG